MAIEPVKFTRLANKSLGRALGGYMKYCHHERNHQGLDNLIPFLDASVKPDQSLPITKFERLGGLLNYRHRDKEKEEPKVV